MGPGHVAAIGIVVVTIGALVATSLLPGPPPSEAGPSAGQSSAAPSGGTGLELPLLEPVATLEPSAGDDAGIRPDAAFTLASLTGEPAARLAERLVITPATPFTVAAADDAATATITPTGGLTGGATYRFALRTPDGALAASWAFRVRGSVTVVSTIPGDATVGVPARTGVEVTFDQEGVADMADHFSIEPAVQGTFERHGRTQVFVPSGLAPATTYTVTIRSGLARTGTDLVLAADVVFRFETEGPGVAEARYVFGRDVIEASPAETPLIAARLSGAEIDDGAAAAPETADIRVYRLASLTAAEGALADFLAAPRWTEYSDPLVPTAGLPIAASFTARPEPLMDGLRLIRFPEALGEGWYVVEIRGTRPAHAFLQVTPVSAWVSVMSDRTVVWVNDVTTHEALGGATVSVGTGDPFGRSDAEGLAVGPTPAALVPPAASGEREPATSPILRVTSAGGDVVLVPFDVDGIGEAYRGEWSEKTEPADETYWAVLYTDRGLYRRTDRIETWGYLRSRDDSTVPAEVHVRLVAGGAGRTADVPEIVGVDVRPGPDGTFTASLPIASLPLDSYEVQAVVDGRVVVARWVDVTIIRKPPYQLEVTADHEAVITGSAVHWSVRAAFFDGTPVATLGVILSGGPIADERPATTDVSGGVSLTAPAAVTTDGPSDTFEDARFYGISVRPSGPESAEIWASDELLVFPSAYDLRASGSVADGRLTVRGTLSEVDLAKVEREIAAGTWQGDPAGAPVARRSITAAVTELVPLKRQVGTEYDFIEKVVRPVYEYDTERRPVRTLTVASAADGTFRLSLAIPDDTHDYEVLLSAEDEAGRIQRRTTWAGSSLALTGENLGVVFRTTADEEVDGLTYAVGEPMDWQIVDNGRAAPSGGTDRYLYLVSQRGLRSAEVGDEATFHRTFSAADAPGIFVIGVRFTGTTYAPKAAAWANFDQAGRSIRVDVSADRERYGPGDTARVSVRTTSEDGAPIAASVVLQAVDEKLYAMDGATEPQPLGDLYQRVDSGILRLTATHQVPTRSGQEGEGGDATGGGPRSDFRDTLLFRELHTDSTGLATTTVTMSDDLTSWRFTASAVTEGLEAGAGRLLVPVGLPFFVEPTVADTYLASDRPVIRLRAFGDELEVGDPIEFTVTSASLDMTTVTVTGTAFEPVRVELPTLVAGRQSLRIAARATTRTDEAGKPRTDALEQTFDVVASRLTSVETAYGTVDDGLPRAPAGSEASTWTFTDAGRGRLVPVLSELATPHGLRIDRAIAQTIALDLLAAAFGRDAASLPPATFEPGRYLIGHEADDGETVRAGVALLPHGGLDPWLAARVAVLAPDALDRDDLAEALAAIVDLSTRRDLQIAALAGLGALGEPVLGDLLEARRQADLTPTELIYLALGFEAIGDDAGALSIERDLLARHGERLGSWVRVTLEPTADGSDPNALLAVIAAGLGDPLAHDLAGYVAANPLPDTMSSLELAAYARRALERTPAASASFAYTVDGRRTVVSLDPGEAFSLRLTAAQASGLAVETLTGRVGAAVEARVTVKPSSLDPHADLTLTRSASTQPLPETGLVVVDLTATFAATAPEGCYDVVELVPSGLAPLAILPDDVDERGITWPSSVTGQEVRFCAANDRETGHTARLRYIARVVNAGTFAWEPAVMQLAEAPELLAITPASTAEIGRR
ncbi:MAG TPA: Ig-like domain-containing protein [Candidatus Limnocylindrales bacterium]|nr:Ig-like domain-containing protein [Candidatus Limnocylindrales bacterium]